MACCSIPHRARRLPAWRTATEVVVNDTGNFIESAGGSGQPNIERWASAIVEGHYISERPGRGGPPPRLAADVRVVGIGEHGAYRFVITDTGTILRADSSRSRPQWVLGGCLIQQQPPVYETTFGRRTDGRFAQVKKEVEVHNMEPTILVGGISRASRPMDTVLVRAWGVTDARRVVWLDLNEDGRGAYPAPVPGDSPVLACDVWTGRALLGNGDLLRWSGGRWYRECRLGAAPDRAPAGA
jgi:hypothetical protein